MEGLGWILFFIVITPIALVWLFAMALELDFKLRNPNAVKGKPPVRAEPVPMSVPQPQPPAPDYLRKWTLSRKLSEQSEMRRWQAEFAGIQLQLARRAGGLHGSSTAAPDTGG